MIPRNEVKIYQKTDFLSSEGHYYLLLVAAWLKLLHWTLHRLVLTPEAFTAFVGKRPF